MKSILSVFSFVARRYLCVKNRNIYVLVICLLLLIISFNHLNSIAEEKSLLPSSIPAPGEIMLDGKIALSAMVALAEGHIKKTIDSLETLTMTEEVKSGNWEKMKDFLAKVQQSNVPATVWFARPDGSYFTVDKGLTDQNLKDREYFPKLIAGEKVIGSLVVSHSTGKKSAVVAVPIIKDGKIIGALGASIFLEQLNEILKKEMKLPENLIFFAIDAQSQTTLNWKEERIFGDATKQGSDSLSKAIKEMLSKQEGIVEYEFTGKIRRVLFQKSPLIGWCFALGVVMVIEK